MSKNDNLSTPNDTYTLTDEGRPKIRSYLIKKFLFFKVFSNKKKTFYVAGHIPLVPRLYLPALFSVMSSVYVLVIFHLVFNNVRSVSPNSKAILILFDILSFLFFVSYFRTSFTSPGIVPPDWNWDPHSDLRLMVDFPLRTREHRYGHDRNRPDRARYSKTFHQLILKPDHVCHLVSNMVGFRNYKFFFLSVLYSMCLNTISTMFIIPEIIFLESTALMIFSALSIIISCVSFCFLAKPFCLHIILISKNLTTIDNYIRIEKLKNCIDYENNYDLGIWKNFIIIFGKNPLFWLFPTRISCKKNGYEWEKNIVN
ncbi:zinc finger dhhc domain containing protein [Anaeramoeba flamelloides]|uniref:Palmitoyltransferase n=1 Tax=Anaeramoeba flamelloides TaxID=1746091 RepID=A0AAV7Z0D7_9EUKA|nr:zinc finger dhhc domain containing protein [Anaeramoeba flamelloides]KAJ6252996.1 zinc finger dhhc domain containing protein [Anaeramoeba flamelloides]